MAIAIVDQQETFRLISDGEGRFAVVEARAGHVYSVHGHERREAVDDPDGMARVVGDDGWFDEESARHRFDDAVEGGQRYARIVW